jgi:membrane protein implicated in regulation of membrane protease activity
MEALAPYMPYLLWIGLVSSGVVILLFVLSIVTGADADSDIDADGDGGGLGAVKSILVFIGIAALTIRGVGLNYEMNWPWVILAGAIAGLASIWLLSLLLHFLLSRQEEGNWYFHETEGKAAKVYIPIPAGGKGRILVEVRGIEREMDAITKDQQALPSNSDVLVVQAMEDYAIVVPMQEEP